MLNQLDKKSISYLRVFATILILCCHICFSINNTLIQGLGQFFNAGVYLFIIISGYLYGKKDIYKTSSYKIWLLNRAKRILIPMYIYMLCLFLIYIFFGKKIDILNWIIYIFNLQGLEIYVYEANHLWYLTIAMICYIITPILDMLKKSKFYNKKNITVFFIISTIIQMVVSLYIYKQFGRYLLLINVYIAAYLLGVFWNSNDIGLKYFFMACTCIVIALIGRISGLILFDETILYNVLIVGYTHSLFSIGFFFMGFFFVDKLNSDKYIRIIRHFDSISYEIYLVHYIFLFGVVNVLSITHYIVLNYMIAIVGTYLAALILNKICNVIYRFSEIIINKVKNVT